MAFLKQSDVKKLAKKAKTPVAVAEIPPPPHRDSPDVALAIRHLASIVSTYVGSARDGDIGSGLYSTPKAYPVRVAFVGADGGGEQELTVSLHLSGDGLDYASGIDDSLMSIDESFKSIADSFKRIADTMTK